MSNCFLVSLFEDPAWQKKSEKPPIITPKPSSIEIVRRLSLNQRNSDNTVIQHRTKPRNENENWDVFQEIRLVHKIYLNKILTLQGQPKKVNQP